MKKRNHKINQIDLTDNKINKYKIMIINKTIKFKINNNIYNNKTNHNKEEENKEIVVQIIFIKFKKINLYKLIKINL